MKEDRVGEGINNINFIIPRARTEPSPANTKIKVETNSAKAALMASGRVASSAFPNAYLRGIGCLNVGAIDIFSFFLPFSSTTRSSAIYMNMVAVKELNQYCPRKSHNELEEVLVLIKAISII